MRSKARGGLARPEPPAPPATPRDDLWLYAAAVESAASAILVANREGRIVLVNRAFTELTGYSREEAVGWTPAILRSWAQDKPFFEQMWRTILKGEVWQGELVNRRKDGSEYSEEMTIAPLRDQAGAITHFVAVKHNIEARLEAERRLRQSEQRFRSLVQGVDAVVWEAEAPSWAYTFVSDQAARLLGHAGHSFVEDRGLWLSCVHPDDRARVEAYRGALPRDGSLEADYRMRGAQGKQLSVHEIVRVDRDPGGAPTRMAGVVIDVSEARQLEHALTNAAEEWVTTFDSLEFAVLVVDRDQRVSRLNRAAAALLGKDWAGCLGRRLSDLTHEPWVSAVRALGEIRARARAEIRQVRDAQGRAWDIDAVLTRPSEDGSRRAILAIRDVTRVLELQDSMKRSTTMAAMGSVVAGVAHEVRNPLFALSVNVDALAAEIGESAEVSELIAAIRFERDRISRLMEDLLDYGRPAPAQLVRGGLEPVLAAAVGACRHLALERRVVVERVGDAGSIDLAMDAVRLEQVFKNLIENACQHSAAGARVVVETTTLQLDGEPWCRCIVRDTGLGFPPGSLPRIFEPFFTRRRGGTGLGLAIVQKVVDEHHGRVRAEDAPGGGALVTVDLPLVHA